MFSCEHQSTAELTVLKGWRTTGRCSAVLLGPSVSVHGGPGRAGMGRAGAGLALCGVHLSVSVH